MAKLTADVRNKLKTSQFAEPGDRKYPIPDENHARAALSRASANASPEEQKEIRAKVHAKFPAIGQKSGRKYYKET